MATQSGLCYGPGREGDKLDVPLFPCSCHHRSMEVDQPPGQGTPGVPSESQKERSPSPVSFARTRRHRPYFTPEEVTILSEKQRGGPTVSEGYEDRIRQQACGFMEAVGLRMGLWVHATWPIILR